MDSMEAFLSPTAITHLLISTVLMTF
jgi:hypothetical protein